HLLMYEVDSLQRPDHHPKFDDTSVIVATDDVHAVDVLALHRGLELQDGRIFGEHGLGIVKPSCPFDAFWARCRIVPGKCLTSGLQIEAGDLLTSLGCEDDRGVEDDVVVE